MAQTIWTLKAGNIIKTTKLFTGQFHYLFFVFTFILFHSFHTTHSILNEYLIFSTWHIRLTCEIINFKQSEYAHTHTHSGTWKIFLEDEKKFVRRSNLARFQLKWLNKNLSSKIRSFYFICAIHFVFVSFRFILYGPGPGHRRKSDEWERKKIQITCACVYLYLY